MLMTVHLGKGLEEIGERAFRGCTLIHHIFIPPCHQGDQSLDFSDCMQLTTAHLTKPTKAKDWRKFRHIHYADTL
jgi:hypothetical protein